MPNDRFIWDPGEYARSSPAQQQWGGELIAKLALAGSEAVLDIGCGDGRLTAGLAARVPRGSVLGVDSSSEMIARARSGFPSLSFEVADARALDFDGRFDVVFSNAALHWVLDHRPVLRGIARALRSGGRALLQMGGKGNAAELFAVAEPMLAAPPWREYFAEFSFPWGFFDAAEYRAWVVDAGLTPVRVELVPKTMTYDSSEGLAAWVRTTWLPYTQRLPEPLREPFIAELVRRHTAAHPGPIRVGMVRLEVEAKKE